MNAYLERSERLSDLAFRLHRRKQIRREAQILLLGAAQQEWDDALHFAAPWDRRVSLCGNWGRNLIEIDGLGDVSGARCWTCLQVRDWLAKNTKEAIGVHGDA